MLPMSKLYTSYSFKNSGTSSLTILYARPSAIAVLPTPGSPTSSTLFFERLPNASAIESSSSLRPIIGSILSLCTSSLRLVVNERSALAAAPLISSSSKSSSSSLDT